MNGETWGVCVVGASVLQNFTLVNDAIPVRAHIPVRHAVQCATVVTAGSMRESLA